MKRIPPRRSTKAGQKQIIIAQGEYSNRTLNCVNWSAIALAIAF